MKKAYSAREASQEKHIPRSIPWVRAGILLGLIKAIKVGQTWVISAEECRRIADNPPTISQEELDSVLKAR